MVRPAASDFVEVFQSLPAQNDAAYLCVIGLKIEMWILSWKAVELYSSIGRFVYAYK